MRTVAGDRYHRSTNFNVIALQRHKILRLCFFFAAGHLIHRNLTFSVVTGGAKQQLLSLIQENDGQVNAIQLWQFFKQYPDARRDIGPLHELFNKRDNIRFDNSLGSLSIFDLTVEATKGANSTTRTVTQMSKSGAEAGVRPIITAGPLTNQTEAQHSFSTEKVKQLLLAYIEGQGGRINANQIGYFYKENPEAKIGNLSAFLQTCPELEYEMATGNVVIVQSTSSKAVDTAREKNATIRENHEIPEAERRNLTQSASSNTAKQLQKKLVYYILESSGLIQSQQLKEFYELYPQVLPVLGQLGTQLKEFVGTLLDNAESKDAVDRLRGFIQADTFRRARRQTEAGNIEAEKLLATYIEEHGGQVHTGKLSRLYIANPEMKKAIGKIGEFVKAHRNFQFDSTKNILTLTKSL